MKIMCQHIFFILLTIIFISTQATAEQIWKIRHTYDDDKKIVSEAYTLKEKEFRCLVIVYSDHLCISASSNEQSGVKNQYVYISEAKTFYNNAGNYDVFGVRCAYKAQHLPERIRKLFLGQWGVE
jgi:hypothetical protein